MLETIDQRFQNISGIISNKVDNMEDRIEAMEERQTNNVTTATTPGTSEKH